MGRQKGIRSGLPTLLAASSTFVANLLWMTALLIIGAGAGAGAATLARVERSAELRIAACMVIVLMWFRLSLQASLVLSVVEKWQKVKLEDLQARERELSKTTSNAALQLTD